MGLTPLPGGMASGNDEQVASRILIVDDSEGFRASASALLAARGFELLEPAPDGEAALVTVTGDCPDGILLDINLPGRDGFAVAASIAAICPAATIVLTSSDTEDVPSVVLRTCGAVAFVPKIELATTDLEALFAGAALES